MWYDSYKLTQKSITVPCVALCAILLLILGVVPILPSSLSQPLRPAFIVLCLLFGTHRYYPIGQAFVWQTICLIYYFIIFICNTITASTGTTYVSMLLFGLFFLFAAGRIWSKREILLMIDMVIFATCVFAVIIQISNPSLLYTEGTSRLMFLDYEINRNTAGFAIAPGIVCSVLMLLHGKGKHRVWHFVCYGICGIITFYTVLAAGCRSAFLAAAIGVFLIAWEKARTSRFAGSRLVRRVALLCITVLLIQVLLMMVEGTYSARLFQFWGVEDLGSGRERLSELAWSLIRQKPLFGGGFDYWISTFGVEQVSVHNNFLSIMVSCGYVGGLLLGIFYLSAILELLRVKSWIPLALSMEMLLHTLTEPGMDYFAYIPLILGFVVLRYMQYQGESIASLLSRANDEEKEEPRPVRQSVIYANRTKGIRVR